MNHTYERGREVAGPAEEREIRPVERGGPRNDLVGRRG